MLHLLCSLPFRELNEEAWIFSRQGPIDIQTSVRPVTNPVAEMQVGVAGITVAHEGFMVTAAGAQRTGETGVAIVLGADVTAIEKGRLLVAVNAGLDVAQSVLV